MVSPAELSGDELDRERRRACLSRAVGEKVQGRGKGTRGEVPAWAGPLSPGQELGVLLDQQSLTGASPQLPKAFPATQIGAVTLRTGTPA